MATYIALRQNAFKAVAWNENFSEMKHFCGDKCKIEYKSCYVDDYWDLEVYDDAKEKPVSVNTGDYVVAIGDGEFTVITKKEFEDKFWEISEQEYKETSCSIEWDCPIKKKVPDTDDKLDISEEDIIKYKLDSPIFKNPNAYVGDGAKVEAHVMTEEEKESLMRKDMEKQKSIPTASINPIPEGSRVLIKSARHVDNETKYLYEGMEGEVLHYWKDNKWGEYNVRVGGGFNHCFDRDELEVIEGNTESK